MGFEKRQAVFEAWKSEVAGDPYNVGADETFIYFAMKRGDPFVQQARDHQLFEGDWTLPLLVYVVKAARRLATNRGYDSVNEMIDELGGAPAWAA
jgi:hypothetical protein